MDVLVNIFVAQTLLIALLAAQKTDDVFHHYGSFPGYYKKYKMSLLTTTTTATTIRPESYPFDKFYPADGSKCICELSQ